MSILLKDEQAPQRDWRLHVVFGVALVSQIGTWLFASPGVMLGGAEHSPTLAFQTVAITVGLMFVLPAAACLWLKIDLSQLGLQLGNWKFGVVVVIIGIPLAGLALYLGCDDEEIKSAYPWAGGWLAESVQNMLVWFFIYGFYYLAFEFFYRGFLLRGLSPYLGIATAMWIQVIMSAMIHFGKPTPELWASIPAGLLFGWLAIKTRSLIYVILIHWAVGIFNDLFSMYYQDWI